MGYINIIILVIYMQYERIKLDYTSLEPYIDNKTLDLHYNILYKGYVDNTNKTQEKLKKARESNNFENIKCLEKDLSFYGSGAILHKLFFENLGPAIPTSPDVNLMQDIIKNFESYDQFKNQFTEAAKAVEASRMVFTCICT